MNGWVRGPSESSRITEWQRSSWARLAADERGAMVLRVHNGRHGAALAYAALFGAVTLRAALGISTPLLMVPLRGYIISGRQ